MAYETVKRNRFYNPDSGQIVSHASRNHYEDLHDFHIPLERMHNSNLHDWGIARGLEVNGTIGGTEIVVNPGVAIDSNGQLISLSNEGHGDIGGNPPNESNEVDVPVRLSTENRSGQTVCVTIQFSEILRTDEGVLGKLEQVPWVRLQQVQPNNTLDSKSIVLAIAVIDSEGKLSELKSVDGALRRRLIGETIEELRVQRSSKIGDQVQDVVSGKVGPRDTGGLRITVSDTQDSVLFASEKDGNFSNFANLEIRSNVGIGTSAPQAGLHIDKANTNDVALRLSSTGPGWGSGMIFTNKTKEYGIYVGSDQLKICDQNKQVDRLVIDAAGNVGIGTTEPENAENWSRVLDVLGPFHTKLSVRTPNIDARVLSHENSWWGAPAGMVIGTKTAHPLSFGTNAASRMTINKDGNIGIGTTSPRQKLDIEGNIRIGGSHTYLDGCTGEGGGIGGSSGGGSSWAMYTHHIMALGTEALLFRHEWRDNNESKNVSIPDEWRFNAKSKNFLIDHPLHPDTHQLVHSTLEGPEIAVFYRGETQLSNGKTTILLPDYFEALTRKENRTVLLTPKFEESTEVSILAASEVKDGKFTVVKMAESKNPSQKFYWEVKAIRADIGILEVERIKTQLSD